MTLTTDLQSFCNIHKHCKASEMGAQTLHWCNISNCHAIIGCNVICDPAAITNTAENKGEFLDWLNFEQYKVISEHTVQRNSSMHT